MILVKVSSQMASLIQTGNNSNYTPSLGGDKFASDSSRISRCHLSLDFGLYMRITKSSRFIETWFAVIQNYSVTQ